MKFRVTSVVSDEPSCRFLLNLFGKHSLTIIKHLPATIFFHFNFLFLPCCPLLPTIMYVNEPCFLTSVKTITSRPLLFLYIRRLAVECHRKTATSINEQSTAKISFLLLSFLPKGPGQKCAFIKKNQLRDL